MKLVPDSTMELSLDEALVRTAPLLIVTLPEDVTTSVPPTVLVPRVTALLSVSTAVPPALNRTSPVMSFTGLVSEISLIAEVTDRLVPAI